MCLKLVKDKKLEREEKPLVMMTSWLAACSVFISKHAFMGDEDSERSRVDRHDFEAVELFIFILKGTGRACLARSLAFLPRHSREG